MTRADLLAAALDEFIAVSPEVEAAAIVSADGLPIASALPQGVSEERLAAMSAALLILGDRAASGMGKGELSQIMVESGQGYVILIAAGPDAVLVAVTSSHAKAGLTLFEMRRTAGAVASIMGSADAPRPEEAPSARGDERAGDRRPAGVAGEPSSMPTWR